MHVVPREKKRLVNTSSRISRYHCIDLAQAVLTEPTRRREDRHVAHAPLICQIIVRAAPKNARRRRADSRAREAATRKLARKLLPVWNVTQTDPVWGFLPRSPASPTPGRCDGARQNSVASAPSRRERRQSHPCPEVPEKAKRRRQKQRHAINTETMRRFARRGRR